MRCNKCYNKSCNGNCCKSDVTRSINISNGSIGRNGESAYEIWVSLVIAGQVEDPNNPGQLWPVDRISIDDYLEYNRGLDGKNPEYEFTEW